MSEKKNKGKKKFPALSDEEIDKEIKGIDKAKARYSTETAEVEKALTEYMEILDPMLWTNPSTGETKAIAWVCRPTMKQLKALVPPEMREYADNPRDIPEKIGKKYEVFFYGKMSEIIAIPKRTPEEWKEKSNPWFVRKFWEHISEIAKMMEGQIEGF